MMKRLLGLLTALLLLAAPAHATISDNDPWIQYTGDGADTTFDYDFKLYETGDIIVDVDGVTYTFTSSCPGATSFTLSGTVNNGLDPDEGGTVTFCTAPDTDAVITIYRDLARERTTDFRAGAALNAGALNDQIDRHEAYQQEEEYRRNTRVISFPITDPELTVALPAAASRASKFVCFDASGNVQTCAGTAGPVDGLTDVVITNAANGDILYFDGTNWVNLGSGDNGNLLTLSSDIPAWVNRVVTAGTALSGGGSLGADITINYAGAITDQSDVVITDAANGDVWYWDGTDWVNLGIGSAGEVLTVTAGIPAWESGGSATFDGLTDTNLTAVATGAMLLWNGADWVNIPIGSNDKLLQVVSGLPSWIKPPAEVILNTPAGGIASGDVQGAINELDSEKVAGPASATDNAVARYDLTTGKLVQDSGVIIDDSDVMTGVTVNANVVTAGTLAHERGGLEADVSGFDGYTHITGGATTAVKPVVWSAGVAFDIIMDNNALDDFPFSATQSGAPSGQTITYTGPTNESALEAFEGLSQAGVKLWLRNVTLGVTVTIDCDSINIAAKTFDVSSEFSTSGWLNTHVLDTGADVLGVNAQITDAGIMGIVLEDVAPTLAEAVYIRSGLEDSGGTNRPLRFYAPTATSANVRQANYFTQATGVFLEYHHLAILDIANRDTLWIFWNSSGAGTGDVSLQITGWHQQ